MQFTHAAVEMILPLKKVLRSKNIVATVRWVWKSEHVEKNISRQSLEYARFDLDEVFEFPARNEDLPPKRSRLS